MYELQIACVKHSSNKSHDACNNVRNENAINSAFETFSIKMQQQQNNKRSIYLKWLKAKIQAERKTLLLAWFLCFMKKKKHIFCGSDEKNSILMTRKFCVQL